MEPCMKQVVNASRRQFLGGWIPEARHSTLALVYRVRAADGVSYVAQVIRADRNAEVLHSSSLEGLASQLIQQCGPAPKSMVRLGIATSEGHAEPSGQPNGRPVSDSCSNCQF